MAAAGAVIDVVLLVNGIRRCTITQQQWGKTDTKTAATMTTVRQQSRAAAIKTSSMTEDDEWQQQWW